METHHLDEFNDEPNSKRQKVESSEGSTSSKPKPKDPFLTLPSDIRVKIIGYIPVAQWPSLESLDKNFQAAILLAWRQLRNVNLERDFLIKSETEADGSSIDTYVNLILQKLVEHSPFLSSLSGILKLNSDMAGLLAQFEHLHSVDMGDANVDANKRRGEIPLENVVELLESTRSRTTLTKLQLFNIVQREGDRATILDRFATSFANGREIQSPLKLEKFSFASLDHSRRIRLDTLDTTRLTDVRVGLTPIEPEQLTNLIERASNLLRIELSFMNCSFPFLLNCNNGQRLQANKKLLTVLSSHENLMAIRFEFFHYGSCMCVAFVPEFIHMLKDIGRRGQLRKLAMGKNFYDVSRAVDMDAICAAICNYLPYLQSVKLHVYYISYESVLNIVSSTELEEIDIINWGIPRTANMIKKIAQQPRLKRLALHGLRVEEDSDAFKYLADVTTLRDLRTGFGSSISADIWLKWSDGFASNLETFMVGGIDDENGLLTFLEKAVRLRVLILDGCITDRSLKVISRSCPKLEILGVRSTSNETTVQYLQEVVNRCPKLNRLGGFEFGISSLQLEKYRKIVDDVDVMFLNYDFDDVYD